MSSAQAAGAPSPPDRPIPAWQQPVRDLVRFVRSLNHRLRLGGKLKMGKNVVLAKNLSLYPPQFLHLGDNVFVGTDFVLQANLIVGDDTLISSRVACIGNDHAFDRSDATIITSGRLPPATIVLEGDNLIGFGSIVVGNVRIGRGCIVGAGSVVTRDLPPYTVCAGVPARPIRPRYPSAGMP